MSLFIKENIKFDIKEDIVVNLPGVDSIAIEIQKEILCSTTDVVILSIYRPPNINPKVFIEKLTDLLRHLHSLKKDVFVLGDFNINMQEAMFTSDRIVNDFHNMFLSHYFYPMINKPTRVHGNRSSIIDNIYTNISNVPVSGLFTSQTIILDFASPILIVWLLELKKSRNVNLVTLIYRNLTKRYHHIIGNYCMMRTILNNLLAISIKKC